MARQSAVSTASPSPSFDSTAMYVCFVPFSVGVRDRVGTTDIAAADRPGLGGSERLRASDIDVDAVP